MPSPDLLSASRVAILGLGLMGGSLAMALRGKCAALLGVDPHPPTLALAHSRNLADRLSSSPGEILPQADLVILAAPVRAILGLLADLPALHPGPAVVMDLGSTKTGIAEAMAGLPERFDPIGGHPMCGKERSSLANADPLLYQGAPFALTPLLRTSRRARTLAEQVALASGAVPLWLDPDTHDRWTAATSHLPYLLANALAYVAPGEASPMVGPGFRSTSRLAVSSPDMMLDVLVTNRRHILSILDQFKGHLEELERLLESGEEVALRQLLAEGAHRQEGITGTQNRGGEG